MKKYCLILILSLFSFTNYSQEYKLGLTHTPGRYGVGIIGDINTFYFSYSQGYYYVESPLYGHEKLYIKEFTLCKALNREVNDVDLLFGLSYNDIYKYEGNNNIINPNNLSVISAKFGCNYNFGRINSLLLFDFVNWEGTISILINL